MFETRHALRRVLEGRVEVRPHLRRAGFLGIELDEKPNAASAAVISTEARRVAVRVMRTDEEWMIAKTVCRVLSLTVEQEEKHDHEND